MSHTETNNLTENHDHKLYILSQLEQVLHFLPAQSIQTLHLEKLCNGYKCDFKALSLSAIFFVSVTGHNLQDIELNLKEELMHQIIKWRAIRNLPDFQFQKNQIEIKNWPIEKLENSNPAIDGSRAI